MGSDIEVFPLAIDQTRCEAYGFCTEAAPALLELDDEGYLHALAHPVTAQAIADAEAAVRVCPVAALRLEAVAVAE